MNVHEESDKLRATIAKLPATSLYAVSLHVLASEFKFSAPQCYVVAKLIEDAYNRGKESRG